MDTRESKYNQNSSMSRVTKNEQLYKEINDNELDNFSVRSNATVIGNQEREIDVEQIKKILDKRYNEMPKRKSIRLEQTPEVTPIPVDDTKEYDLSKVLEKAKDEKQESYEEARAKSLRNTQYDILNNLNIGNSNTEEKKEKNKTSEEDLMNLINTITVNEAKNKVEDDPLDLLTDLKGSDNTQVYESMAEDVKNTILPIEEVKQAVVQKAEKQVSENKSTIDNSFYTTNVFKKRDFEDDGSTEFVDDTNLSLGIKILIGVVVVGFLVGLFIFLKSFIGF